MAEQIELAKEANLWTVTLSRFSLLMNVFSTSGVIKKAAAADMVLYAKTTEFNPSINM